MIAVLAVGAVAAPAFAGDVSVGRFYTELAKSKHLVSVDAVSAEASLRGAGFSLPALQLDKSLTEGDMTSISNALGLNVTTQKPSQVVTEAQLNTYMSSFSSQLSVSGGTLGREVKIDPFAVNGAKGKKKGHHKSTTEPL
jgi:hypothetical protein